MEFTHYYGKYKQKNTCVAQSNVAQNKTNVLRARMDNNLYNKIKEKCLETGKGEGELTRLLWMDYFKKIENKAWQEETKDW